MVQRKGTQVESSGLLELKRQYCKCRDTKDCLTDYWRRQTYGEREGGNSRYLQSPSSAESPLVHDLRQWECAHYREQYPELM